MLIFPVQLTTSRIGNLTRLIHTLLYVMTIHTCYYCLNSCPVLIDSPLPSSLYCTTNTKSLAITVWRFFFPPNFPKKNETAEIPAQLWSGSGGGFKLCRLLVRFQRKLENWEMYASWSWLPLKISPLTPHPSRMSVEAAVKGSLRAELPRVPVSTTTKDLEPYHRNEAPQQKFSFSSVCGWRSSCTMPKIPFSRVVGVDNIQYNGHSPPGEERANLTPVHSHCPCRVLKLLIGGTRVRANGSACVLYFYPRFGSAVIDDGDGMNCELLHSIFFRGLNDPKPPQYT